MKDYLLDTHVWFWLVTANRKLSANIRRVLGNTTADNVYISPVSILELGLKFRNGQVKIDQGFESWIEATTAHFPFNEIQVDHAIAMRAYYIPIDHNDPADRLIAATAVEHDLTLLTQDRRLIGHDWLKTVS